MSVTKVNAEPIPLTHPCTHFLLEVARRKPLLVQTFIGSANFPMWSEKPAYLLFNEGKFVLKRDGIGADFPAVEVPKVIPWAHLGISQLGMRYHAYAVQNPIELFPVPHLR